MVVFVFPGEGAWYAGVVRSAAQRCPGGEQWIDAAAEIVGREVLDAAHPSRWGVQVAVFVANHLRWRTFEHAGLRAKWSVGRGVGEFNHLVHIGALDFADALQLVDARGRACDRSPAGAVANIHGPRVGAVEAALAAGRGFVEISTYAGPIDHVIAGELPAVRGAVRRLQRDHDARCTVRRWFPVHTDLCEPVAAAFESTLHRAPWKLPVLPYFPNVRGEPLPDAFALDFIASLRAHVHRPVQWSRSLQWLAAELPGCRLLDVA